METPLLRHDSIVLEPLDPGHAAALAALVDEELWAGMTTRPPMTEQTMRDYIHGLDKPDRMNFVVRLDSEVAGSTCLYDITPGQRRLEIGSTFYARKFWGTTVNPAAKLLLLTQAFDAMGTHRVGLRCDARNTRSAAAIQRLGATPEGVLRGHRLDPNGEFADTAYFSILENEWPVVREALHARLG